MQPQTPAQEGKPPEGDFRFGHRLRKVTLPDGSTDYERVPLTVEDVLHPEPDDKIPVRPIHAIDCRYLVNVLRARVKAEMPTRGIVYVSDDHLVDWGVPGQRHTSPDVGVFVDLKREVGLRDGTFDLKASGGRPLLVIEVVSPDERRENDVVHKVTEYYNAGVPLYVIVDQKKEDAPRVVKGFRWRSTGWEQLGNDPEGLLLEPLELFLDVKDGRVVCRDARTGGEPGDYETVSHERDSFSRELDEADRRIQEQGQALEHAVSESREQRLAREAADRAREAAEKREGEQAEARKAAEKLADAQKQARAAADQARAAAEKLAREQKQARDAADQAREAAEERIRQLEAALRALQPPA
jgi:Uma2 family endonuclease